MERKVLTIADAHHPYIDKIAYKLTINVALEYDPDEIILLGDFGDWNGLSSHGKNPAITESTLDEIDMILSELCFLKTTFPKASITFVEGNHSFRAARYIAENCPEFYGVLSLQKILMLDALNIKYVPYTPNQCYKIGKLNFRHEPIGGGINAAHNTVVKAGASVIYGHLHKIQESQIVTLDGSYLRAVSVGCLCDKDLPAFQYVKFHHQWQLGFAMVTFKDDYWFCQNIHIIPGEKYRCLANGKIYEI